LIRAKVEQWITLGIPSAVSLCCSTFIEKKIFDKNTRRIVLANWNNFQIIEVIFALRNSKGTEVLFVHSNLVLISESCCKTSYKSPSATCFPSLDRF